jgi:CO/xanthine dehydrogenase Mo-binding subunit
LLVTLVDEDKRQRRIFGKWLLFLSRAPASVIGFGKGGLLPVASAVANAIARAVGVRIQELPLTPPKIWRAL